MGGNKLTVEVSNLAAYTPDQTTELISRAGVKKGNMRPDKVFLSAVSAGCLLSFGCAVSLTALAAPYYAENAPGPLKLFAAATFPLGLVLVVLTGADLFTATTMFTMVATLHGRLPARKMLLHWLLCFFGNFAGSLFTMSIIFGYGRVFEPSPFKETVQSFVTKKQVKPEMHEIFLKAIGCNWLVCLAIFLGTSARDMASKVIGLWFPVFAFVSLGLDHVVANMFFIPLGIWLQTPHLDFALYIWKGIIPATLGNILGGGLFCGVYYWYMYLLNAEPIKIDGVEYDGRVIGAHTHSHTHLSFLEMRRKSSTTTTMVDEESRIEHPRQASLSK